VITGKGEEGREREGERRGGREERRGGRERRGGEGGNGGKGGGRNEHLPWKLALAESKI
jgi:hypothetical protein